MRLPNVKAIQDFFLAHPYLEAAEKWSKTHSLPGFFGVPVYDVMIFLYNESKRVTIATRANAMAFSFFLSLFPAIIFLFTVATLLPIYASFEHEINGYIDYIMPTSAGKELQVTIKEMVKPDSRLLSIGFLLAIYFSSNGMLSMMSGFEKTHLKSFRKRTGLRKRLVAMSLTFALGVALAVSVVLIILGNTVINLLAGWFQLTEFAEVMINLFRWIIILALFYMAVALLYRYGPALRTRFKWFTPGATLASILSIITSVAFSFYVDNFDTYNKVYGSIGAIIVLMLWMQINCFILQVGFELNASIAVNRDLKEEIGEES